MQCFVLKFSGTVVFYVGKLEENQNANDDNTSTAFLKCQIYLVLHENEIILITRTQTTDKKAKMVISKNGKRKRKDAPPVVEATPEVPKR